MFYWDKKEALSLLQTAGLQLPGNLPQDGFAHSIRENGSKVKHKFENVTKTQQFKRWFGKSKVVNKDGTPKVMYHGSKKGGGFTVFKDWQYFTENKNYAERYAEREGFLNHFKDILDKDALLYADKSRINSLIQKNSQNANSDVKLELLERLDAIGYNKIIHQSRNLVKTYSMQNSKKDTQKEFKLQEPIDVDAEYGSYVAAVEAENAEIKELIVKKQVKTMTTA